MMDFKTQADLERSRYQKILLVKNLQLWQHPERSREKDAQLVL